MFTVFHSLFHVFACAACRYLAPELLSGRSEFGLDRADMFALGATLYELATGATLPTGAQHSLTHITAWDSKADHADTRSPCLVHTELGA